MGKNIQCTMPSLKWAPKVLQPNFHGLYVQSFSFLEIIGLLHALKAELQFGTK